MIEEHRAALEYDWRSRFHLPLSCVGSEQMEWGEFRRLVKVLAMDPSSQTCAALQDWKYPASLEVLALYDIYDLTGMVHAGKKFDRHKRPFELTGDTETKRLGNTGGRSRAEVVAILNAHGHSLS